MEAFFSWAPVLEASVCQAFSIYASIPENGQSRASLLPWGPPGASVVAFGAKNREACALKSDCPAAGCGLPQGPPFPLSFWKDWDNSEGVYKVTAVLLLFHKSQSRQVTNNPSFQKASIWARMLPQKFHLHIPLIMWQITLLTTRESSLIT